MSKSQGKYIRSGEIARLLGTSQTSVIRWGETGVLPAPIKIGCQRRWLRTTIEAFARSRGIPVEEGVSS